MMRGERRSRRLKPKLFPPVRSCRWRDQLTNEASFSRLASFSRVLFRASLSSSDPAPRGREDAALAERGREDAQGPGEDARGRASFSDPASRQCLTARRGHLLPSLIEERSFLLCFVL